ncbi:MAG: hypothetical protein U9Q71_02245 [Pseudomonadota bacterium]|nr:hypothetical protein [Pseudomonadota bacterium]
MAEKKTPGSLSEVSNYLFQTVWNWVSRKSMAVKFGAVAFVLVGLVLLARFNIFGDPYLQYAKILLPANIPYVDPEPIVIPWETSFLLEGRKLEAGATCYAGDRIRVGFTIGAPAWVTVFDVDAKGPHPVFQNKLDPSHVKSDRPYTLTFPLDDTVGDEIFYVIASETQFSFKEDIEPHLMKKTMEYARVKGPRKSEYTLDLDPEMFLQDYRRCYHRAQD